MWINLTLNFTMIPRFGAIGAAIGTLVTEIWNVFWMSTAVKDYRRMIYKNINYFMYVIALLLGGITSMGIHQLVIFCSNFWKLVFTAGTFFGVYYLVLLIGKEPLITKALSRIVNRIGHRSAAQ